MYDCQLRMSDLLRHVSIRYLKIVSTAEAIYTFASLINITYNKQKATERRVIKSTTKK